MPHRHQKGGRSHRSGSLGGPTGVRRSIDDTSKKVKHATKAVIAQAAKMDGHKVTSVSRGRQLSLHDSRRKSMSETEMSKPSFSARRRKSIIEIPLHRRKSSSDIEAERRKSISEMQYRRRKSMSETEISRPTLKSSTGAALRDIIRKELTSLNSPAHVQSPSSRPIRTYAQVAAVPPSEKTFWIDREIRETAVRKIENIYLNTLPQTSSVENFRKTLYQPFDTNKVAFMELG
ncbi:hypothetical protein HPB51_027878 [Rhipicephalus microplus]|uniref:Uncharacterized protein n=1 Tax=Rhipicephalus microplus TaxID=6941 RepID=A0A9J6CYX3_RHIMP|nr:hypothetical protein HPB51_027878 [Rhipicephalus microplus]